MLDSVHRTDLGLPCRAYDPYLSTTQLIAFGIRTESLGYDVCRLKRRVMTHRRKNHRCLREDRSSGSGAWALVEDFDRGLFGRQSKSHYSSDHRENRNMCFLTVFLTGGRRSGMYGPALSVDDKSPRHSLSLVKDSKFWGCGRMRGQPEVAHPRCHLETAQHANRVRNSSVWQVSNPPLPVAKLWFVLRCLALIFFQLEAPCATLLVSNSVTIL